MNDNEAKLRTISESSQKYRWHQNSGLLSYFVPASTVYLAHEEPWQLQGCPVETGPDNRPREVEMVAQLSSVLPLVEERVRIRVVAPQAFQVWVWITDPGSFFWNTSRDSAGTQIWGLLELFENLLIAPISGSLS